jgi:cytochrome c oxidase cbb3-type subunit 3
MRNRFNKFFFFSCLLLMPAMLQAAENTGTAADQDSFTFNPMLLGLLSLMLALLFAIGAIANVLKQLVFVYRDKLLEAKSNTGANTKILLLLICLSIPALQTHAAGVATTTATVMAPVSNVIEGINKDVFYLLMFVIALELFVLLILTMYVRIMIGLLANKPALVPIVQAAPHLSFWTRFHSIVPIERERDILLDHDYDGIQELDNSLPPWWKYGFILSIIVAIIYFYRYQVAGTGPNPQQEYAAEMQQADEDKAAYLAKSANNVDESTVQQLTGTKDISAGQQIFQSTCFPCHAKDGGGGVGPNLTDDYWLHGGSIKDVFKSIKYGWQDKGMKSWKDDFSSRQIAQIASYVKTLHGTKPAVAKEKQGELYIEGKNVPKADSANKVVKN